MIRRWFINLFREVLAHELLSIHTLLGEVLMEQHLTLAGIKELNDLQTKELEETAKTSHDGSGAQKVQEQAISSTRPSWPRMKRYLEERDARQVIAEQQASGEFQNAAKIANKFNEEAAKLEAYWRNKSVKE